MLFSGCFVDFSSDMKTWILHFDGVWWCLVRVWWVFNRGLNSLDGGSIYGSSWELSGLFSGLRCVFIGLHCLVQWWYNRGVVRGCWFHCSVVVLMSGFERSTSKPSFTIKSPPSLKLGGYGLELSKARRLQRAVQNSRRYRLGAATLPLHPAIRTAMPVTSVFQGLADSAGLEEVRSFFFFFV